MHTYNSKYPNVSGHFHCDGTSSLTPLRCRGTLPRVDIQLRYAHMSASRSPFQRNLRQKRPRQCSAEDLQFIPPLCVSVQGETSTFGSRSLSDISYTARSPGVRVGIVGIGGLGFVCCRRGRLSELIFLLATLPSSSRGHWVQKLLYSPILQIRRSVDSF